MLNPIKSTIVTLSTAALTTSAIFAQAASPEKNSEETQNTIISHQDPAGPLQIERVKNSFVLTPDFKITELDDDTVGLAGAYGGWLVDNTLLIGFGGYFHTNPSDDQKFGYGGLVVEWFTDSERAVQFSVRGLIGGGRATLGEDITLSRGGPRFESGGRGFPFGRDGFRGFGRDTTSLRVLARDTFFVAEPQANVFFQLSRHFRLGAGVSYRLIGASHDFDERLRGASASVSLQFGSF